jgi:uncharacterized protein
MKVRTIWIVILCLVPSALLGQVTVSISPDSPSHDDILKLFDVMRVRDLMNQIMGSMTQQMRSMEHEQIRRHQPNVTDEQIAKLDAISDDVVKSVSFDGLLEDMVPVYQKHLSKPDVDAMIAFYTTPTGQKVLREMPAINAEGMQAMQPRLRRVMDEANDKVEKMLRDQMQEKKSQ